MKEGSIRNFEFIFQKKSGEVGTGLLSAELIEIAGHQCAITASIDITERLRLEAQLRQAHKLEGLGRLAGGVAHDFNNLLTVINGYSDLILRGLPADDPLYPPIQEIKKAAGRGAGLTKQLLAFSRKQVIKAKVLDLNVIVNDSRDMFQRLIGEDIAVGACSIDISLSDVIVEELDPPAWLEMSIIQPDRSKSAGPVGPVLGEDLLDTRPEDLRRDARVFEGIADDEIVLVGLDDRYLRCGIKGHLKRPVERDGSPLRTIRVRGHMGILPSAASIDDHD